jgi:hypothetical protein
LVQSSYLLPLASQQLDMQETERIDVRIADSGLRITGPRSNPQSTIHQFRSLCEYEYDLKWYASDGALEETGGLLLFGCRAKVIRPKQIFLFNPQLIFP